MLYTELHTAGIIENDAEFGSTNTYFYSSFVPQSSHTYPFVKRDTVKIDSVVLSLAYSTLYGDSLATQTFEVREIQSHFKFEDTGYKIDNPDLPVEGGVLGSKSFLYSTLNDSLIYRNGKDTVRTAGELRIHLDTSWARRFVNYDTTVNNAYNNDSLFQTNFRGVEVRPSDGSVNKNALAYFNLNENARTRITFYCRIQNNGKADTIAPYFIYKARYPEANLVRRTPANNYLTNVTNSVDNDEKIYLQSTPGSYAIVNIPALSTLSNRVIHRAELIIEKAPSQEENVYAPPAGLFIEALSNDSVFTVRNDFIPTNTSPGYDINTLGGALRKDKYTFNLTRHVQSIVTKGYRNNTLRISSPFTVRPWYVTGNDAPFSILPIIINSRLAGGRVVLNGGGYTADTTKRMRLHIIYSKI
jgi:hypothetical protein